MAEKVDRDCKTCAYSSPYEGIGNGCITWACEYINKREAIEAYKIIKAGGVIKREDVIESWALKIENVPTVVALDLAAAMIADVEDITLTRKE